ncbi:MAG: thermonuclease family protein [Pseudomonadota bacterium]
MPTGVFDGPIVAYIPSSDRPVCAVTRVVDGDTLTIDCGDGGGNARLVGFDMPETFRPGCSSERRLGETAKDYLLVSLKRASHIGVNFEGTDKYQRLLIEMSLDGRQLADIMIARGVAVRYSGGSRIDWCQRLGTI